MTTTNQDPAQPPSAASSSERSPAGAAASEPRSADQPRGRGSVGAFVDHCLAKHARGQSAWLQNGLRTTFVETSAGRVRVHDSGSTKPCVVMAPDGPNTIEHYARLIELLSPALRVVCFDMPGFGYSIPAPRYSHTLDEGARAILDVLDRLNIGRATLAFSCANGLYAVRHRIEWPAWCCRRRHPSHRCRLGSIGPSRGRCAFRSRGRRSHGYSGKSWSRVGIRWRCPTVGNTSSETRHSMRCIAVPVFAWRASCRD
uniref:AB hydrolase-1 domain-containing protein n=1 Tax=Ralstonia solanacearum TaxID=305 RepID=A0A0S4VBG3_RALSL|nr:protein of unknown function [Ralstonia solanacearum]